MVLENISSGKVIEKKIIIEDPELGPVERSYQIKLPEKYDHNTPTPMVMRFHGQGEDYPNTEWFTKGTKNGYIIVQPKGMDDHESKVHAWNTGLFDKGPDVAAQTCFKNTEIGRCYTSCKKLNYRCNACSWATCYDDGLFIQKLMESIQSDYCINLSRVYASGQSNGGMMLYYLIGRFPEMFNAIKISFAIRLVGLGFVPSNAHNIDLLHQRGRSDVTIPDEGVSEDGWIFESLESTHERWAREQNCTMEMGLAKFVTPYDGGKRNITCKRKNGCIGDIIRCSYDGGHGDLPDENLD